MYYERSNSSILNRTVLARADSAKRKPTISNILFKQSNSASRFPNLASPGNLMFTQGPPDPSVFQIKRNENSFMKSSHSRGYRNIAAKNLPLDITESDLPGLVHKCFTKIDHEVSPISRFNDNCAEMIELTSNLETIFGILSRPGAFLALQEDILEKIIELSKFHLIRHVSPVSSSLIYGDTASTLYITNWQPLMYVHKITMVTIQALSQDIAASKYSDMFVNQLIKLFDSPDQNEQISVEQILALIFDKIPSYRQLIFRTLLGRISAHLDRQLYFMSVPPAIRFFVSFFKGIKGAWNPGYSHIFKTTFLPLFETEFVSEFYTSLSNLCLLFYMNDSENAWWGIEFLLRHWPKTNSTKQVAFLHQLSVILPWTREDPRVNTMMKLVERIGKCLVSSNFKVCMAALRLAGDPNFLSIFSCIQEFTIGIFSSRIKSLSSHWCPEVQAISTETYGILRVMNRGQPIIQETRGKTIEERTNIWKSIFATARQTFPDMPPLDISEITKQTI